MKCPCRAAVLQCCSAAAAYKLHWYSCSWLLSSPAQEPGYQSSAAPRGKKVMSCHRRTPGHGWIFYHWSFRTLGCRMDKLLSTVVDIFCFSGNISPILLFFTKMFAFSKKNIQACCRRQLQAPTFLFLQLPGHWQPVLQM